MDPVIQSPPACRLDEVKPLLLDALKNRTPGPVSRVELTIEALDFFDWLSAQAPCSSGYWSDRESGFELVGIGNADMLTGTTLQDYELLMDSLHDKVDESPFEIRYFGGFHFAPDTHHDDTWNYFKGYRFVLPRFEIIHRDGQTVFAMNVLKDEASDAAAKEVDALVMDCPKAAFSLPGAFGRTNNPGRGPWLEAVEDALHHISSGGLEKVVLARKSSVFFNGKLSPVSLLWHLRQHTRQRFHFCFQPVHGHAFVGASPERLYRRDGRSIMTEAIAGTRPVGKTEEEQQALADELLGNVKELREHQYVVDSIRSVLSGLTSELTSDLEPELLVLNASQHLATRFKGRLRENARDGDLLKALHPTPAVGGFPREAALDMIGQLEHFHRGWYAAPVGWITRDAAQFAVGIRSALVDGMGMYLFSGAGIVEGSDPAAEWDEIENKISDFKSLFNF